MQPTAGPSSQEEASHAYWLVTRDTHLDGTIREILGRAGLPSGDRCDGLYDLAKCLEIERRPVVIVDCDSPDLTRLSNLEQTINCYPATRFICLSSDVSPNRIMDAMSVGIRHFVQRDTIQQELAPLVRKYVEGTGKAVKGPSGRIVTVLSAAGGCGATTFAVNLANSYTNIYQAQALVVDLCESYGTVATSLGLHGRYSLADVLSRESGQIDAQLVVNTCIGKNDRLHALISPASINFVHPRPLRLANLEPALTAFRHAFPRTVIDAPRVPMEYAATLANHSHATLILFQLNVKDLRLARSMQRGLIDLGVKPESLRMVAGRVSKKNSLTIDDARQALELESIDTLTNDYKNANASMNIGEPLPAQAPLQRDIEKLALLIDELHNVAPQPHHDLHGHEHSLRLVATPNPVPIRSRLLTAARSLLA